MALDDLRRRSFITLIAGRFWQVILVDRGRRKVLKCIEIYGRKKDLFSMK